MVIGSDEGVYFGKQIIGHLSKFIEAQMVITMHFPFVTIMYSILELLIPKLC